MCKVKLASDCSDPVCVASAVGLAIGEGGRGSSSWWSAGAAGWSGRSGPAGRRGGAAPGRGRAGRRPCGGSAGRQGAPGGRSR